jgi:nucleolar complex protein 3
MLASAKRCQTVEMASKRPSKRRRLTPPTSEEDCTSKTPSKPSTSEFYTQASKWNLEQDYEQKPRKNKKRDKENTRLPIKTAEGAIEQVPEAQVSEAELDSFLGTDSEDDQVKVVAQECIEAPKVSTKQQILDAKEELARLALLINEDPEEHIGSLKKLWQIAEDASAPAIKKLALATQAAVYGDIIPGYRIRPLKAEDTSVKVSKDVRKVQNYEQSLLSNYQGYVKQLITVAKPSSPEAQKDDGGLRSVAISCASSLLKAAPHFNFRNELLKLLVDQLSARRGDEDFKTSLEAIESLLSSDEDGALSLDAATLLTKMMKAKDYRVDESLLNVFLYLRLLSEFSSKASSTKVDKEACEGSYRGSKKIKDKREFRTKKQRKNEKERKIVEKDMQEANAIVSYEEREKMQAETLKLVFATYFRILKLRVSNLISAVLEGLATYAHLINQDFFGDLLEALKDLIRQSSLSLEPSDAPSSIPEESNRNHSRESLLCTITAFALLSGQDSSASASASKSASALNLDLSFFITHIYTILYPLSLHPDIELGPYSFHLPDPSSTLANFPSTTQPSKPKPNRINVHTPSLLLLRTLTSILTTVPPPPPARLASFTKKLLSASLHTPEKTTVATLSLLQKLTKTPQGKKTLSPLWNTEERRGDRVYDGGLGEGLEGGNGVFGSTVWEGELLRCHYCPGVREAYLKGVEGNIQEGGLR